MTITIGGEGIGNKSFFTDLLTGKSREAAFRQEMEAVYDSPEYQAISECIFDMNIGINMIANAIANVNSRQGSVARM